MSRATADALLIYVDPGYQERVGHYQNLALSLIGEAQRRNLEVLHIVGSEKVNEPQLQATAQPWFRYPVNLGPDVSSDPDRLAHHVDAYGARLLAALRRVDTAGRRRIRLFLYTGHPRLLPVTAEVLNQVDWGDCELQFCFNLFYLSNAFALRTGSLGYGEMLEDVGARLEALDPQRRIRLSADSERIINVCQPAFARTIERIPVALANLSAGPARQLATDAPVTLGYFGYTSAKQGYALIRQLYAALEAGRLRDAQLLIRHNIMSIEPALLQGMRELVGARGPIENHIHHQGLDDYLALLRRCDVILLPYRRQDYPVQSSGMLLDAIANQRVAVVPRNTWLADQCADYKGLVCFDGESFDSFLSAVEHGIALARGAPAGGWPNRELLEQHHAGRLLDQLFAAPVMARPPAAPAAGLAPGRPGLELLGPALMRRLPALVREVYAEKIARGRNLGWHYVLDLIWLLSRLDELPRGSWVLDAGAGDGLLQYLLVRRGYRVISVDFTARRGPADVRWLSVSDGHRFDNAYVRHLETHYTASGNAAEEECVLESPTALQQLMAGGEGDLIYYRCDLADMALLADAAVDAVVSVSALEHNERPALEAALAECWRVLKPAGALWATTSATDREDWFHAPSKGWCYGRESLRELFGLPAEAADNFAEHDRIMRALREPGNALQIQLAPFYFRSGDNGMPWGNWDPQYLPVGVAAYKAPAQRRSQA